MKEDILEQVVDDYLQTKGYFTRHNLKFKPERNHPEFVSKADCVPSDIDVIGVNPNLAGPDRVWVVSCKSWQSDFHVSSKLTELAQNKRRGGRESWRYFRELVKEKWSDAFCEAVFSATGSRVFTYVTAVTRYFGDRRDWESNEGFRKALHGNPIRLISLKEMVSGILRDIPRMPSSSDLGRTLQLLNVAGIIDTAVEEETETQYQTLPARRAGGSPAVSASREP